MARINLGNFGNYIAAPQPMQAIQTPDSGHTFDLAIGASRAYEAERDRQFSMQNAKDIEVYSNEMRTAWSDVYRDVSDGKIEPSLAYGEYERRRQLARENIINSVQDDDRKKGLEPLLELSSLKLDSEARAGQVQLTTNANRKTLNDTLGLLRQESLSDLDGAIKKADALIVGGATGAGYTPAQASEMRNAVGNDLTYDALSFQIEQIGVEDKMGSYAKLKQLAADVSDPQKYSQLTDGGKRAAILRQIDARKNDLDRLGREEKQATSMADARMFKDLSVLFESGGFTTPDAQQAMGAIAARNSNNSLGERATDLIKNYTALRNFSTKPLNTQEQMVAEQKALSIKAGDPLAQATAATNADLFARALDFNKKQFERDPFGAYQQMTGAIAPPLNMESVATIAESMKARQPFVDKVSGFYGKPVGMLSISEAKTLSDTISTMPPDQQENFIKGVVGIADERTLGMIGKANPTLMVAGAAWQKNVMAEGGTPASTVVLNGKRLLDDKKFDGKGSFDSEFEARFQQEYSDAFRLANADDMVLTKQTLKQAYAYYASLKGQFAPDVIDDSIFSSAASVLNPITDFNGRKTFAPVGMNVDLFEDSARKSLSEIAKRNGYDKAKARNFINNSQLVQVQENVYLVYDANGNPIINETGAGLQTVSVGW